MAVHSKCHIDLPSLNVDWWHAQGAAMIAREEANMDHRYYGLKALFVGAALVGAVYCSNLGCQRLMMAGNSHYQAAALAEAQMRDAGLKLARTIGHLLSHPLALL